MRHLHLNRFPQHCNGFGPIRRLPAKNSSWCDLRKPCAPLPYGIRGNIVDQQFQAGCSFIYPIARIRKLDAENLKMSEKAADLRYVVD